ncbi:hypothetical protein [Ancylobacter terrae]|uniref:hypothetical protein n=1 Tax=Ancylobacter sp. sgz301288 TaxID=3342077 RepID=UPI00385DBED6
MLGAFAMLLAYPAPRAIPEIVPADSVMKNMDARIAAAGLFKDLVSFLVSVSFALTAVLGLALGRSGLNSIARPFNAVLVAVFILLLARCMQQAYHAYSTMALQIEAGLLYSTSIGEQIQHQALSVIASAFVVFVTVAANVKFNH